MVLLTCLTLRLLTLVSPFFVVLLSSEVYSDLVIRKLSEGLKKNNKYSNFCHTCWNLVSKDDHLVMKWWLKGLLLIVLITIFFHVKLCHGDTIGKAQLHDNTNNSIY